MCCPVDSSHTQQRRTHVVKRFVNQALHTRCMQAFRSGRYGVMNSLLPKLRVYLCVLFLGLSSSAGAMQVAGVDVPERVQLADAVLELNGAGVRRAYFLEVYVASLYLPARQKDALTVLNLRGNKRLQMVMLMSASSQDFNKAMVKGMRRNSSDDEFQRLQSRVHEFEHIINSYGAVKRGDVIGIDHIEGKGTVVSVNGQARATPIAGEDFYNKILEIFLGTHVSDAALKQKLLGH
jgi:Chalcone isomerase-like